MRSMRRGIREMDLILDAYAGRNLGGMDAEGLDRFEALLDESDHDLYQWISGQTPAPGPHAALIDDIVRQLPRARG
ncbi:succinate dehydrogenase assembly factor 2 [Sulfitobacter sp. D35]|uniref:succinate dehydrogenase assembly factor 2 n=1 Tax=Sulfitobacter sp. D35 TaxID=3083252 RepID=UPI00296FD72A|nr:succinate dehydrogenase assembly factor 2 [Sulfitobacter sp. D35]MDW4499664.1 succinate dehydrogenase assembly factor 2 [Sulfitobacter sp. D35]